MNDKNLDHIKPNTLVRFRCMIQDMFEPEYYLSRYETIDTASGTKVTLGIVVDNVGQQFVTKQTSILSSCNN